jgi:hypothetical protein
VAHTEKTGGQYVAQTEKMGNECSMWHTPRKLEGSMWHTQKKWELHKKLSGKSSLMRDNYVKINNTGTVHVEWTEPVQVAVILYVLVKKIANIQVPIKTQKLLVEFKKLRSLLSYKLN